MIIINKKRVVILICAFFLTIGLVAAAKNIIFTHHPQAAELVIADDIAENLDVNKIIAKADTSNDFFAEYRMERERLRGKQLELLKDVITHNTHDEKAKTAASMRIVEITVDMEKEMQAESLVKSAGFSDCVVILQAQTATIVIQSEHLTIDTENELHQIVSKAVNLSPDKMTIIVRKPK